MVGFNDYLNEINKTIRTSILKVQFLRADETPLFEVVNDVSNSGTLNIQNKNGVRRSTSFDLTNFKKEYFPELDSPIWIGKKFKLWLGYRINGEDYFLPQGVFVMDDPTVNSNSFTVGVSGIDKFAMLDGTLGGEIDSIFIINAGVSLTTAINSVMLLSNDPKPVVIDTALGTSTLPYQIIKETGDTIGSILIELAEAFSCNIYYNEDGFLVFEKDSSDSTKGVIHVFSDGEFETNYSNGNIQHNFSEVYNSCLVIGDNINGAIATGKVSNLSLIHI